MITNSGGNVVFKCKFNNNLTENNIKVTFTGNHQKTLITNKN